MSTVRILKRTMWTNLDPSGAPSATTSTRSIFSGNLIKDLWGNVIVHGAAE